MTPTTLGSFHTPTVFGEIQAVRTADGIAFELVGTSAQTAGPRYVDLAISGWDDLNHEPTVISHEGVFKNGSARIDFTRDELRSLASHQATIPNLDVYGDFKAGPGYQGGEEDKLFRPPAERNDNGGRPSWVLPGTLIREI